MSLFFLGEKIGEVFRGLRGVSAPSFWRRGLKFLGPPEMVRQFSVQQIGAVFGSLFGAVFGTLFGAVFGSKNWRSLFAHFLAQLHS